MFGIKIDTRKTLGAALAYTVASQLGAEAVGTLTLALPFALAAWEGWPGLVIRKLHAARGGSWAPRDGFREYFYATRYVLYAAAVFFTLWAVGAHGFGL